MLITVPIHVQIGYDITAQTHFKTNGSIMLIIVQFIFKSVIPAC